MSFSILSSTANFLFKSQPSHITKHYQRYVAEAPISYVVYAAMTAYFAYRCWQVYSHVPGKAVARQEARHSSREEGGQQHQRATKAQVGYGQSGYQSSQYASQQSYSHQSSQSQYAPQQEFLQEEFEYADSGKCELSFQSANARIDTVLTSIRDIEGRLGALEERHGYVPTYSQPSSEMQKQYVKRDNTRRISGIAGSLVAMTLASNWSFTPFYQLPQFFTILAAFGCSESTYYFSPANAEYRARCQFDEDQSKFQKCLVGILHVPFVHDLDKMAGNPLGKLAGIERNYSEGFTRL